MEFDDLIDNSQRLENTVQAIIKGNAQKQANVNKLQAQILESYNVQQRQLAEVEQKFQVELTHIKAKSDKLEFEIKQVNTINDELSEVVNRAQQASHDRPDASRKINEAYHTMGDVIEKLDIIRANYNKVTDGIKSLDDTSPEDSQVAKKVLEESKALVVELHKNSNLIRLLEKQGKFAEQQFDLILNQIPWEPLTANYIKELRQSSNEEIRTIADVLALQVSEIQDLDESLVSRKEKKLEILKSLTDQLELFVRKRSEAILIDFQASNHRSTQY